MKTKQASTEGQVYRCTWKKRGRLFELKCLSPVAAESADADLERAKEGLWARIMDMTGDGEAQLQFVPALPEAARKPTRFVPEYYHVEYNDLVDWAHENHHQLFTEGVCNRCGTGLGLRTDVPRVVTSLPRYDVVGFRKDKNVRTMFSEAFLKHIRPFLTADVRFIEVKFEDKIQRRLGGKRFHEIDFEPSVEVAVPRANDGLSDSGFRCPKCKTQHFFFSAKKLRAQHSTYAVRSLVQGRVLFLGQGSGRVIALDAELHERILKDKQIKGIVTDRLVMLLDDEALSAKELQKVKLPDP